MLRRAVAVAASSSSVSRHAFHAGRALPLAVHTVHVPSMGDSISEGTLVQVVKGPGDAVHADEVVAVLETDKVHNSHRSVEKKTEASICSQG
jgi:hypothetical protein